jgi:hypothetical protein
MKTYRINKRRRTKTLVAKVLFLLKDGTSTIIDIPESEWRYSEDIAYVPVGSICIDLNLSWQSGSISNASEIKKNKKLTHVWLSG